VTRAGATLTAGMMDTRTNRLALGHGAADSPFNTFGKSGQIRGAVCDRERHEPDQHEVGDERNS
jgi:hypothetical protein